MIGISFKEDELARPEEEGAGDEEGDAAADTSAEGGEFAARRLSVHNPYDEDWNELPESNDDDSAPEDGSGSGSTSSTQRA